MHSGSSATHRYQESIPAKKSESAEMNEAHSNEAHHYHHDHHHHHDKPWPANVLHSDPQASVKTAPAVPSALKSNIKLYQWIFAATAGAIIAIILAVVHAQASRLTAPQPASAQTPTLPVQSR
jgi:hypothetical protein